MDKTGFQIDVTLTARVVYESKIKAIPKLSKL